MKYSNKMNKLYEDYAKQWHRRDETFEMMTIKVIVEELESGNYDDTKYSKENVEMFCDYLCRRYFKCMSKLKEKLEERRLKEGW